MFEVREVLRLWLAGEGIRATERLVGFDRKRRRWRSCSRGGTLPPFLPIGKTPAFGIVKDGEIDDEIAKSAMPDGMGVFLLLSFTPTTGVEDAEHLTQSSPG